MIAEIKDKYQTFGDATFSRMEYRIVDDETMLYQNDLAIVIWCFNCRNDNWEKISLVFKDVSRIRIVKDRRLVSRVFEALILESNEKIVFDFFPIQVDGLGKLEEDPNSDLSIHCKEVVYEVLH